MEIGRTTPGKSTVFLSDRIGIASGTSTSSSSPSSPSAIIGIISPSPSRISGSNISLIGFLNFFSI